MRFKRLPKQPHLARVRPNQAQQHANRRRLAGAVWSKKTVDTRGRHQQVEIVHRDLRAEATRQATRFDQVVVYPHQ